MKYYQFNIGDYKSHTSHLDLMEDIAYRRMLDWYYVNEKPLPESVDEVARVIGMRTHIECIANVLREFFTCIAGEGWRHARVDFEIAEFNKKSDKARASANERWNKHHSKQDVKKRLSNNANAMRTHSEGNANQEPRTKNQELKEKSEKKFSDDDFAVADFIWQKILVLNPAHKKPNLDHWAEEIRLIRERDNRTLEEIRELFSWANTHGFWKTNILSPKKLREKWDVLVIQKTQRIENGTHQRHYDDIDNSAPGKVRRAGEQWLREREQAKEREITGERIE